MSLPVGPKCLVTESTLWTRITAPSQCYLLLCGTEWVLFLAPLTHSIAPRGKGPRSLPVPGQLQTPRIPPDRVANWLVMDGLLTPFQVGLPGRQISPVFCGALQGIVPHWQREYMGVVYLCEHPGHAPKVAVKILPAPASPGRGGSRAISQGSQGCCRTEPPQRGPCSRFRLRRRFALHGNGIHQWTKPQTVDSKQGTAPAAQGRRLSAAGCPGSSTCAPTWV